MAYLNDMQWQSELFKYDDNERKVLLTLSHEKYRWRTKERIAEKTGLSASEVDKILAKLMSQNEVRASISKKKNIIFGLTERVG